MVKRNLKSVEAIKKNNVSKVSNVVSYLLSLVKR